MNPILSIVVEMGTREITHRISADVALGRFLNEARRSFADAEFEILLVGSNLPDISPLPDNCRCLDVGPLGYYAFKNAGAQAANGRYIVFWDSDTRPKEGYLQRAIKALEENTSLSGVTGATRYDGSSYLTRLNTVLSFGFLFQGKDVVPHFVPMGHNIVIRKEAFPEKPFGPFTGRTGGADYISHFAKQMGRPLQLDSKLEIFHEDMSYSLRALIEQHLREMFGPILHRPGASRWTALMLASGIVFTNPLRRLGKLVRYSKRAGFRHLDRWLAIPVIGLYAILDLSVLLTLICIPSLTDRWLNHQFGKERAAQ